MRKILKAALLHYLPQYLNFEIEDPAAHQQAVDELASALDKLLNSYTIGPIEFAKLAAKLSGFTKGSN